MASGNKFNSLVGYLCNGTNMNWGTDIFYAMLTNTAPVATNTNYASISGTELANGNGYTTGGVALTTTSSSQTGGVEKLIISAASPTWTATGSMGPFRYVVVYDFTATTPVAKPLLGWWDYGSSITLSSSQTFTLVFDSVNGVIQLS